MGQVLYINTVSDKFCTKAQTVYVPEFVSVTLAGKYYQSNKKYKRRDIIKLPTYPEKNSIVISQNPKSTVFLCIFTFMISFPYPQLCLLSFSFFFLCAFACPG